MNRLRLRLRITEIVHIRQIAQGAYFLLISQHFLRGFERNKLLQSSAHVS